MAKVSFVYKTPTKKIGGMDIDAFLSEGYHFSNSVTDIPVEEGSIISDHVVEDQDTVDIQAFIGCVEPYDERASLHEADLASLKPIGQERIILSYNKLRKLKSDKTPIDIVMGLDTFQNMIITAFDIDRDVETGADLQFTMQLKHIKVVKSESTKIAAGSATGSALGGGKGGVGDQAAGTSEVGVAAKETPEDNYFKQEADKLKKQGSMKDATYKRTGATHGY